MESKKSAQQVLLKKSKSGYWIIQLNIPKTMNALSTAVLTRLAQMLDQAEKDPGVRSVILFGGEKSFSSGSDTTEFENKAPFDILEDQRTECWSRIHGFSKPLIAAVNRFALGSGCELAMHCDIVIASEDAYFGHPEINLGLIPGAGGSHLFSRAAGKAIAMRFLLTGDYMPADVALRCGIVSEVVKPHETLTTAISLAEKISKKSAKAISFTKQSVTFALSHGFTESRKVERHLFSLLFSENRPTPPKGRKR
jgi:enoyl-CoA hydratase